MLRAILNLFAGRKEPDPITQARAARRAAAEAFAHATSRGDTRDAHWALKAYRRATNDLLRLEKAGGAR
jgi:hypothetical protein